jgi:predicted porin
MKPTRISISLLAGASAMALLVAMPFAAHADDYTDLLDILRAKGTISRSDYNSLMAKHMRGHAHHMGMNEESEGTPTESAAQQAEEAAARAQAAATLAQQMDAQTQTMMHDTNMVTADPFTPGKGITMHAGGVTINVSGFINGYYSFNAPSSGTPVAGGLSTGGSGFDSSAVRNGLLPAGLITKLSSTQDGLDIAAVFGVYPGINNSAVGALNANNGGEPVALGTPGIDFRQVYVTVGNAQMGTVKVGRDIGLFGADAILNDATLLGVGSTGSNANPGNTSLGRIGIGYVYTDWLPQITYTTPAFGGFTASAGVFSPLDEFSFSGYSASATAHRVPMFQGQLEYKGKIADATTHFWADFLVQPQENITGTDIVGTASSVTAVAGDAGASVNIGPLGGVVYYYRGSGLGSTALFFDGVAPNGKARDSEGYYVQGSYNITPKTKLVGSYGVSDLYQAPGEADPLLVRRNESEVGGVYYSLTAWMTLVGEYAHTDSHAHGGDSASDSTVSVGTIVMF